MPVPEHSHCLKPLGGDRSFSPLTKGRRKGDTVIICQMGTQTRRCAACTKRRSVPERLTGFLQVIPETAELHIISYKLSETERKLKVYINYKA